MDRSERRFAIGVSVVVLLAAGIPTVAAYAAAGDGMVFGGILLNPLDGNSYLAKIYQGWQGDWKFHLPYTVERGSGVYIHLYYLWLGHLARWTGLSIAFIYNMARLAGTGFLLAALWHFYGAHLGAGRPRRTAFSIAVLTLGMGWLALPFGLIPADFWVAEAYPFLAALTNPHFPLALALIAILANPESRLSSRGRLLRDAALAFLLGLISPFGVVIASLPWIGAEAWSLVDDIRNRSFSFGGALRRPGFRRAAAITAGGLPVLLYDVLSFRADPVLSGWNSQNLTLSPAWWDLALSLSPALVLAFWGLRRAPRPLLAWAGLGLALVFVPFALQRRFMMGLYIPLAGLAGLGIEALGISKKRSARWLILLCFLPGPLVMLLTMRVGIATQNPRLFLMSAETEAFQWAAAETDRGAVFLAGPETGLFLPAYSGRRVIYGHPFETVNADYERAGVEAFFTGMPDAAASAFLQDRAVDYVYFGPREAALGDLPVTDRLRLVFDNGEVQIYAVQPE